MCCAITAIAVTVCALWLANCGNRLPRTLSLSRKRAHAR
ncbi:Uncharacterised protein [Vibrio cholerae]|nr:Uncharacterised protein [Vibrio cholerae]